MRGKLILAAIAVCALSGTAAACGGSSGSAPFPASTSVTVLPADPRQAVTEAYPKTVEAKTAKLSLTGHITGGGRQTTITGQGELRFNPIEMQLTLTDEHGQPTEVRVVNGADYIRSGSSATWMKVDLSQLTGNAPSLASPDQVLSFLQGVTSQVTTIGPTVIRGVPATGYRATIDLDQVAARQTSATGRQAIQKLEQLTSSTTLPLQVWLDPQGRIVRETNAITLHASGQTITADSTTDLFDFGTPVTVAPPPASNVTVAPAIPTHPVIALAAGAATWAWSRPYSPLGPVPPATGSASGLVRRWG